MCKQNTNTTGQGQMTQSSGCNCKASGTGGCATSAKRFDLTRQQPLGVVHHVDPALIQVGLPGGKNAFDRTEHA